MKEFVFNNLEWATPNSYDSNYKRVPNKSGVYLIVVFNYEFGLIPTGEFEILYVGSSKNLYNRYSSHPIISKLKKKYYCLQFYFMECDNFRVKEIDLIKSIRPKYNKQHNGER